VILTFTLSRANAKAGNENKEKLLEPLFYALGVSFIGQIYYSLVTDGKFPFAAFDNGCTQLICGKNFITC
jgi:hypothetical protein